MGRIALHFDRHAIFHGGEQRASVRAVMRACADDLNGLWTRGGLEGWHGDLLELGAGIGSISHTLQSLLSLH